MQGKKHVLPGERPWQEAFDVEAPTGYGGWMRKEGWSAVLDKLINEAWRVINNNKRRGQDESLALRKANQVRFHALLLLQFVPPTALAKMASVDVSVAENMTVEEGLETILAAHGGNRTSSRPYEGARTTLLRLLEFASQRDAEFKRQGRAQTVLWRDGVVRGADVAAYLDEVKSVGHAKFKDVEPKPGFEFKPGARTGACSHGARLTHARFLGGKMGMDLGMETSAMRAHVVSKRLASNPFLPIPLRAVCAMEHAAIHEENNIVRGLCAGFVCLMLAVVRITQGAMVKWVSSLADLGVVKAASVAPKDPRGPTGNMEPFYLPTSGVLGDGRLFASILACLGAPSGLSSGGDAPEETWLLRDFWGNDPWNTTGWRDQALTESRATDMLRLILRRVAGMSESESMLYGAASVRHMMAEAFAEKEAAMCKLAEIGRHSKSLIASVGLSHSEKKLASARAAELDVPRKYAPQAAERQHARFLCETIQHMRQQVRAAPGGDWRNLPSGTGGQWTDERPE